MIDLRRRPVSGRCLALIAFLISTAITYGGTCNFSWVGQGVWSNPSNWSPNGVPDASNVNVCLANGLSGSPAATELTAPVAIASMLLGGFNTLNIDNGVTLTVNGPQVVNAGVLNLNGAGGATSLLLNGNVALSGGGTLTFSGGASTILNATSSQTLENVDNKIQGAGDLGHQSGMWFTNDASGIVTANVSGQVLTIDPSTAAIDISSIPSGGVTNAGAFKAENGGILQIQAVVVDAGGTFTTDANPNSVVKLLPDTTIEGGTFNGKIQTAYAPGIENPVLDGTTHAINNQGTLTITDGTELDVSGTINNTGAILVNGASNGATLSFFYSGTLTGGGTVTLSTAGAWFTGGDTVENVDNLVHGEGHIGYVNFQNDAGGVVNADSTGHVLYLEEVNATNKGFLKATNGGTLELLYDTIDNSTGTISADSGVVQLAHTAIDGGQLNGNVQITADSVLSGITNTGTITVNPGSQLQTHGIINNTGTIQLSGTANAASLFLAGDTTLTGGGTVSIQSPIYNYQSGIEGNSGTTLENVDNVIQGEGGIGAVTNIMFKNDAGGVVDANSSGQTLYLGGMMVNQGTMEATGGGILELSAYPLNNSGGTISTDSGKGSLAELLYSTIQGGTLNGNVRVLYGNSTLDGVSHGTLTNAGSLTVDQGVNTLGTINNTGTILLSPSAGILIEADTTLTGAGTLTLGIPGNTFGSYVGTFTSATLDNVDNLIQGYGNLGGSLYLYSSGTLNLNNEAAGTIKANVSGQTLFVDAGGTFSNTGTLQAEAGSKLVQNSGTLSSSTFSGSALLAGRYIVNGGTIQLYGFGNNPGGEIVNNQATIVMNGAGAKFLDAGGNNALAPLANNSGSFTIGGGYDFTTVGDLANSGSLTVGTGSTLTTSDLTSTGGITVGSGGTLSVSGDLTVNGGTVDIQAGGTLDPVNVFVNGSSALQVDGDLIASNVIVGDGANLAGDGTITAAVTNAGLMDPGVLHVNGDYTQTSTGTFLEQIAGPNDFGRLLSSGPVSLDGTLDISLLGGYTPELGMEFLFIDSPVVTGVFSTVNGTTINGDEYFALNYDANNVELCVEASGSNVCPGAAPAVPEPSSFFLAAGAMLASGCYGRKRVTHRG